MASCKKCDAKLIWKQPYKKGDRPVNPNGTPHTCEKNGNISKIISRGMSKHDYKKCDYCTGNSGWLRLDKPDEIAEHMRKFHPGKEVRNFDYFTVD